MKVPFCDFTQNVSQALSMCISMWIKVNKWNYLKIPHRNPKILFVLGSYEYFERLKEKLESAYPFMLKYSKITVCMRNIYSIYLLVKSKKSHRVAPYHPYVKHYRIFITVHKISQSSEIRTLTKKNYLGTIQISK